MLVIMKLCKIVFVFVLLGCLVCCEIPEDILPEFEAVFKGEGLDCDGTSAAVQVQSERNEVVGEGEVRAISEAVGESLRIMHEKPTVENAVALAESSSKLVLEVVALARASVSAQINSPNAGCFAVAFGKAEAVAVARAAVTAIAQAFAQASSPSSSSSSHINTTVQNVEKDVQVVVERIVLLLADGSGGGEQSVERNVQAEARAKVVNCALASAFAAVGDLAEAEVLAQAGCTETETANQKIQQSDDCECAQDCGLYGDKQNADYICYMKSQTSCSWAQKSIKYDAKAWRYCGPTMEKMQSWLKLSDKANLIDVMPSGQGYSGAWDYHTDKMAPSASPTPPSPPQPYPPINPSPTSVYQACPVFQCIGDARDCCRLHGSATCNTRYGRTFLYVGKCREYGVEKDVWGGAAYQCMCT